MGNASDVRFTTFPRTRIPPDFIPAVIEIFRKHEPLLSTINLAKGLTSDKALEIIRYDLKTLGFQVEMSKKASEKIKRPVFFGENGAPDLQYEIDSYHPLWKAGLEVEAGRAWMGNAIYRDLIQAMVMVDLEHLILAVPNAYRYMTGNKPTVSRDYENTVSVADALFGHSRITIPFTLTVVGY